MLPRVINQTKPRSNRVPGAAFGVFASNMFKKHLASVCLCACYAEAAPRARGEEVWAWAAIWRDHWWCSLFNPHLTTQNPSVPLSRPLPEEEMKGPPVLVVGETQLPWIDEWLLCRASPLFLCPTPPLRPCLPPPAYKAISSWIGFCSLTFI